MVAREVLVLDVDGVDLAYMVFQAPAGTVFVYHRGSLIDDAARCERLAAVRDRMMSLCDDGWVTLSQRRLRQYPGYFEYRGTVL